MIEKSKEDVKDGDEGVKTHKDDLQTRVLSVPLDSGNLGETLVL